MRRIGIEIGGLFGLIVLFISVPALADDWQACDNISYKPLQFTVPACTRLIEQAGLDDAQLRHALQRRADAYYFGSRFVPSQDERGRLLGQALADLDRALALGPGGDGPADPPAWLASLRLARADVLFELGRFEDAAGAYAEAMEAAPDSAADARLGRALSLANLGRFDEALAELSALIQSYPEDANWVFLRAGVHEKAGSRAAAIADYETVVALDPGHIGAKQALQRLGETETQD